MPERSLVVEVGLDEGIGFLLALELRGSQVVELFQSKEDLRQL